MADNITIKDGTAASVTLATKDVSAVQFPKHINYDSAGVEVPLSAGLGSVTEAAPASDTASSGLNGRLQRIAQRITSMIALLPAALGQGTMTQSMRVVVASDQSAIAVDSELPAAAALADGAANPTTPQIAADNMAFNGATWDRVRNNINTATGDSGAKIASGNGATQTNYNARGALVTILMGAVTGTTPTFAPRLEWSPDGGTTWLSYGPAGANITTTGNHSFLVYPTNVSQAAGVTPANLTTGATQLVAINAPLPRTWRLVWVIGGTTPSFTITSVQVNYLR